jgi:large subunit ribosomal protein L15
MATNSLKLNTLKPAANSKKTRVRVGRGIGSGKGKTCGRGHKGQTARSGYSQKIGFEGGQMPLHRRVPKFGFTSLTKAATAEIRLSELNKITAEGPVTLKVLRKHNIIGANIKAAKVILSGQINKAIELKGISVTSGAKDAILAKGGKIEE